MSCTLHIYKAIYIYMGAMNDACFILHVIAHAICLVLVINHII